MAEQDILSSLPDKADSTAPQESGILNQIYLYLTSKPDTEQPVHPALKGGIADPNLSIADKLKNFLSGVPSTTSGIPIVQPGMQSVIPDMPHPDNEGWLGYGARALFNTLVSPLGSPSGFMGAGAPGENSTLSRLSDIIASDSQKPVQDISSGIGQIGSSVIKPKLRLNLDGTITDLSTGEILDKTGKPVNQSLPQSTGKFDLHLNLPTKSSSIIDTLPDAANIMKPPPDTAMSGEEPSKKFSMSDIINIPRTIKASVNLHAPLRQGLPFITKKEWWTSLDDMIKAYGSDNAYKLIQQSIQESPNVKSGLAARSGLYLADLANNREESIASKALDNIPLIKGSQRGYTTFLNKLRSDVFDSMVEDAKNRGMDPESDTTLAKAIAGFINTSTGRGSLGAAERYATLLNNTMFSPRLMASRMQMLNPAYYINLPPMVRREALKALFTAAGTGTAMGELAKMGGAEIINDPTNADFRKIKIGNVRLDPYGGFQQYGVLASRLISAKDTSSVSGKVSDLSSPKFGGPTRMSVLGNFAANKLNPVLKMAYDWLSQSKGQPFQITKETADLFTPMFVKDIYDVAKENPSLIPVVAVPTAMGMTQQVYGP